MNKKEKNFNNYSNNKEKEQLKIQGNGKSLNKIELL